MTKNAKFESVRKNIEHYLSTDWFMWVCFLIACFITVLRVEAIGLLIFAAIICAILVFCEDVIIALEPFLLLCLCLIKCNNSYDEFIKMVWLAVPAAAAIIFQFHLLSTQTASRRAVLADACSLRTGCRRSAVSAR